MIEIFNQDRELVNMDYICAGDELISIIEMVGLEFFENKFLGEYEVHKIKVFKNNYQSVVQIPTGYIFSDKPKIDLKKLPNIDNVEIPDEPKEEPVDEAELNQLEQIEEPVEEPVEEPMEEPIEEPVEESVEEPIEEPVEEPVKESLIITENDIVTDMPIIPKKDEDMVDKTEQFVELDNKVFENELEDEEYYSDSEYDLDDDLDDKLVDLSIMENGQDMEKERIMNLIRERENELLKLKGQLEVK